MIIIDIPEWMSTLFVLSFSVFLLVVSSHLFIWLCNRVAGMFDD